MIVACSLERIWIAQGAINRSSDRVALGAQNHALSTWSRVDPTHCSRDHHALFTCSTLACCPRDHHALFTWSTLVCCPRDHQTLFTWSTLACCSRTVHVNPMSCLRDQPVFTWPLYPWSLYPVHVIPLFTTRGQKHVIFKTTQFSKTRYFQNHAIFKITQFFRITLFSESRNFKITLFLKPRDFQNYVIFSEFRAFKKHVIF